MVDFVYSAVDKKGHSMDGIMSAESELELDHRLQELGYWLIDASKTSRQKNTFGNKGVSRKELVDFFNGLNSMLSAGISISESISAIAEETEVRHFSVILRDLKLNVEAGNTLDDAMGKHPKVFNNQIVNLIKAGEYSGNLGQSCEDISEHLEWLDGIMSDIKQASIYPILIFSAVMGLVFLMFTFVVPRFSKIFDSMNLELPPLTQAVVSIGEFTSSNWYLLLTAPIAIIVILKIGPKYSAAFGYALDKLKLNLPVFGKLNRMIVQSTFCHNLALLLKAGVPILQALSICKGLVGNRVMERAVLDAELAVTDGQKMTNGLRAHNVISSIVMRMMVVGEETGRLDQSLEYASIRFDKEVPRQIKRVFGVLEPMIMLVLISIVGLIGGAVFLPMFSMMSGLSN